MIFIQRYSIVFLMGAVGIVPVRAAAEPCQSDIDTTARKITVQIVSADPFAGSQNVQEGSGVIIGRQDTTYFILTNYHVAEQDTDYAVLLRDATSKIDPSPRVIEQAALRKPIDEHRDQDLAVLSFRVNGQNRYSVAELGDSTDLSENISVSVAGWPTSPARTEDWKCSTGKISGEGELGGEPTLVYNNEVEQGMSGGPVLNQEGKVVGIHSRPFRGIERGEGEGIPIDVFIERVSSEVVLGDTSSEIVNLPSIENDPVITSIENEPVIISHPPSNVPVLILNEP